MQARALLVALPLIALNGCGLVFQGLHQDLALLTKPASARVAFRGTQAVTPASVRVRRRSLGYFVYRAQKDGYQPACQVITCGTPRWIKVLDSIPLALPLLVDLAFGTLADCTPDPSVTLIPLRPSDVPFSLPQDDRLLILDYAHGGNACQHPYLYDPAFAQAAQRIMVTAGSLQQQYEVLGPLDFGRAGGDWVSAVTVGAVSGGTAFSYTQVSHFFYQATPGEVNELVRRRALLLYGTAVDAVVNVAYQTNPSHDVYATGLAVHFSGSGTDGRGSVAARLEALEGLREKGLVTEQEYQKGRQGILSDL